MGRTGAEPVAGAAESGARRYAICISPRGWRSAGTTAPPSLSGAASTLETDRFWTLQPGFGGCGTRYPGGPDRSPTEHLVYRPKHPPCDRCAERRSRQPPGDEVVGNIRDVVEKPGGGRARDLGPALLGQPANGQRRVAVRRRAPADRVGPVVHKRYGDSSRTPNSSTSCDTGRRSSWSQVPRPRMRPFDAPRCDTCGYDTIPSAMPTPPRTSPSRVLPPPTR